MTDKNGPPLQYTMRGTEAVCGNADILVNHWVIVSAAGTGIRFTSGQLSEEIIIVRVCSSEHSDAVHLHAA